MSDLNFDLAAVTAASLAKVLGGRLGAVLPALDAMNEAAETLNDLGVEASAPEQRDAFPRVIGRFLKDLEDWITRECREGTLARADLQTDFFVSKRDLYGQIGHELAGEEAVDRILKRFPFEGLAKKIHDEASQLQDKGLQESANLLARDLHLIEYRSIYGNTNIKFKSGRLTSKFTFAHTYFGDSYSWSDESNMRKLTRHIEVLETEMGCIGLTESFEECSKRLGGQRFASRDKVVVSPAVEFVNFNGHMDIRFSSEATDMLMAFLKLHSSAEIVGTSEVASA
jgi:hypothetical protein